VYGVPCFPPSPPRRMVSPDLFPPAEIQERRRDAHLVEKHQAGSHQPSYYPHGQQHRVPVTGMSAPVVSSAVRRRHRSRYDGRPWISCGWRLLCGNLNFGKGRRGWRRRLPIFAAAQPAVPAPTAAPGSFGSAMRSASRQSQRVKGAQSSLASATRAAGCCAIRFPAQDQSRSAVRLSPGARAVPIGR
jgi:hypothetical protein